MCSRVSEQPSRVLSNIAQLCLRRSPLKLVLNKQEIRLLLREVVQELLIVVGWPPGRIALDEAEAAAACGVKRHVLRDLRLGGKVRARRLGRKIVYLQEDLLQGLQSLKTE